MLVLLITYLILNLFVLRKKGGKDGPNADGAEGKTDEKEALIRAKIEHYSALVNRYIFAILRGVAWVISAIFCVVICLLFFAIYCTIFEQQWLASTPFFGADFISQITHQFGLPTTLYGLTTALILLLVVSYSCITLLLKRKVNKWFIYSALIVWISLIFSAVISYSNHFESKAQITNPAQTIESSDNNTKGEKEVKIN